MKIINVFKMYLVVAFCSAAFNIHAQPAGSRILIDSIAEPAGPCDRIEVTFAFPVQYLTHFPKTHGKELRVQVSPLAGSNQAGSIILNRTESIRLMDSTKNTIKEIFFDGTFSPNRPYLIFDFANDVYLKVVQGERFRSIVVFVSSQDNVTECQ